MRSFLSEIFGLGVGCVVLGMGCSPVLAQSPLSQESATNWNLTLGAGVRYQPDYQGSDNYLFRPRPIVSLGRGLAANGTRLKMMRSALAWFRARTGARVCPARCSGNAART